MAPRKLGKAQVDASSSVVIPELGGVPRKGALAQVRGIMQKVFPKEQSAEVRIDENRLTQSHPHLSTGSMMIDFVIGGIPNQRGVLPCPGFPRGRLINIYGAESSGKTTLALTAAAETCRRGEEVCYIDWEHAIDIAYAKSLGVPVEDPDQFLLVQPETLEKGMSYLWGMAKGGVALIIIDSVAAGATKAQWDQTLAEKGEIGRVGAKAAKWSEYLPQLKALIARTNSCIVGISQLRSKIDTGYNKSGGDGTTQQGGWAWKFYSEVRMGLRKIQTEKGKSYDPLTHQTIETPIGNVVVAKVDKCKVAASQGREAKIFIRYGEGIDDVRSVIEICANRGIVKKSGSWYAWERSDGTSVRGQGLDSFKAEVLRTPGAWDELHRAGLAALAVSPDTGTEVPDDIDEDGMVADDTIREIQAIMDGGMPGQDPAALEPSDE